jgi:hypothetical protein
MAPVHREAEPGGKEGNRRRRLTRGVRRRRRVTGEAAIGDATLFGLPFWGVRGATRVEREGGRPTASPPYVTGGCQLADRVFVLIRLCFFFSFDTPITTRFDSLDMAHEHCMYRICRDEESRHGSEKKVIVAF